jgi:endogenous inhibitor of DNA gyrase (YacG/DUF329 family)
MTRARLCPICQQPLEAREDVLRFRPFCSKRCADVDLGRWLRGAYAIPANESEDSEPEMNDATVEESDESDMRH